MTSVKHTLLLLVLLGAIACLGPATAGAQTGGSAPFDPSTQPPRNARIVNGKAVAPVGAPRAVVRAIAAANRIVERPYRYGGGHARFEDTGYDCSGTVSYALHGAGLLRSPLPSGPLMRWGRAGKGRWITVYANPGHTYVMIAGLRLDTGYRDAVGRRGGAAPGSGPRWGGPRSTRGYAARHPAGL